jgi:hypothetical protein
MSFFRIPSPSGAERAKKGRTNMKTELDALGTAENESGSAKHENGTRVSGPPKTCPGAQNMKTGPDTLSTAENESRRAKHENRTRRPPNCPKQV